MRIFLTAAVLLSLERLCYIWIWHRPDGFRTRWAAAGGAHPIAEPVNAVGALFAAFKALQIGVFVWWCYVFGDGVIWPDAPSPAVVVTAVALVTIGQLFNLAVFYRLGGTGVFYGSRFGHDVPWSRAFPFSWLEHPQYVGTVLSIWGFFLFARFPHPDWIALPALETVYYALGARFER